MDKFNIIYADPPWSFDTYSDKGKGRSPEQHYSVMTIKGICALPVADIAAKDSILFMWATYPRLPEAFEVINTWGFAYKTVAFTWAKLNPCGIGFSLGLGFWTRANPEICLLATRGKPKRVSGNVPNLVIAPRGRHSAKPPEVRERIVKLVGDLPRIELFARERASGWACWGNQVQSDIDLYQGDYPNPELAMELTNA
jgi:N6-adenosine-specific RNA methylase IME4